jgi:hypothetical protein
MLKNRCLVFALLFILASCDVNNSDSIDLVEIERLETFYPFNDIYPNGYVFNSEYRWELFWKANTGDGAIYNNDGTDLEIPVIDFENKTLIGVFYDRMGKLYLPNDPDVYYSESRLVVELDSLVQINDRDATYVPYLLFTVKKTDAEVLFTGNTPNN